MVQLAAHAKNSTLYGRSYGRTSKFFRLDGSLLFRIISSAIKKWKVKNENRVFQRLVRKKRKKHRMLSSVLVLWSGLKRSWFLKPKEERSYLYECRQMWATMLIAIKQKRNGTTSIAIYMRRVSRITKYTKMDPKSKDLFLPGSERELFTLSRYQEVWKDFTLWPWDIRSIEWFRKRCWQCSWDCISSWVTCWACKVPQCHWSHNRRRWDCKSSSCQLECKSDWNWCFSRAWDKEQIMSSH